jgi:hypothetical protein
MLEEVVLARKLGWNVGLSIYNDTYYRTASENKEEMIKMYEWSKGIVNKVKESGCLNHSELANVEASLRLLEIYSNMTDVMLFGVENGENPYELTEVGIFK